MSSVQCSVEIPGLDGVAVIVEEARIREHLHRPYEVSLVLTPPRDHNADPSVLVNDECTLTIERPGLPARRVVGLVSHVRQSRRRGGDAPVIELNVAPALAFLAHTRSSRIFQEQTVPEILQAVLGEALGAYGREVRDELSETYPKREHCVQYQESNLDFVQRLMEEEGITYAFDHEGAAEVMILRDRNADHPELERAVIRYAPTWSETTDEEWITDAQPLRRTTTTSVVVHDYDFTGPSARGAEARSNDELGRDRESYEHGLGSSLSITDYDDGVHRYQAHDASRQARVRSEAHAAPGRVITGTSRVTCLAPGWRFSLAGHPSPGVDGEYLVVGAVHHDRVPAYVDASQDDRYHNTFEAIPVDVPCRPERRTPKPQIHSVESAVVVGAAGEEIHTDAHARVRVQFHWDREGANDEHSTCWLRVAQPWAGEGWGFLFVPRIGMEASVAFEHGDPDRPIVIATTYDAAHSPPYPLPDEKTRSTLKSESSVGGGGYNELRFEDDKGNEEIYLHAQKDLDEEVLANHTTTVGNDQTNTVDHDQAQTIHGSQTEEVKANQTLTIETGNRTVNVFAGFDETIHDGEKRKIKSGSEETILGGEKRTVAGLVEETIKTGGENRTLVGNQTEVAIGSLAQKVNGASTRFITGSLDQVGLGGVMWAGSAAYALTAIAGFDVSAKGGLTILAPTINIVTADEKETDGATVTQLVGTQQSKTAVNIAFDAIALSAQGMAFANVGIGIDKGAARAEAVGGTFSFSNVAFGQAGTAAECGVFKLIDKSFRMID